MIIEELSKSSIFENFAVDSKTKVGVVKFLPI